MGGLPLRLANKIQPCTSLFFDFRSVHLVVVFSFLNGMKMMQVELVSRTHDVKTEAIRSRAVVASIRLIANHIVIV